LILLLLASLYSEALELYQQERFAQAEQKLRQVRPPTFDSRFLLGATLVRLDRPREAIVELKAAVALRPSHADARKLLAAQYLAAGEQAPVIELMRGRLADEESHLLILQAFHDRGDAGDRESALAIAQKALKLHPASPRVHAFLGYELKEAGRLADAKPHLEKAIALDPQDPLPQIVLADVYVREGKPEQARQLLAKWPNEPEAQLTLARALAAEDKPRDAIKLLLRLPESRQIHFELSRLYAKIGDSENARRHADLFRQAR
jgi:predicted Zn-dependent protease